MTNTSQVLKKIQKRLQKSTKILSHLILPWRFLLYLFLLALTILCLFFDRLLPSVVIHILVTDLGNNNKKGQRVIRPVRSRVLQKTWD